MVRLFWRLFVLLIVGYALSLWIVKSVADRWSVPQEEQYNYELLRGQVYELVRVLRPLQPAEREPQLARLRPHYGLQLALVDGSVLELTALEQHQLQADRFIGRNDFTQFIARLDPPRGDPALAH